MFSVARELVNKIVLQDSKDGDDGEFDATPYQLAVLIFVIITLLVIVTILFELMKDYAIDSASKYTKPIVLCLFSEMTVLGFLSLITFVIGYGGTLEEISEAIFGDTAGDYVDSTLETIHYTLFLVMILTIIQVFLILAIGHRADEKYEKYNEIAQDEKEITKLLKEADILSDITWSTWIIDFLKDPVNAYRRHAKNIEVEEAVIFFAIRKEHIERRHSMPPYHVLEKDKHLPPNFDFAMYQSICLSNFLVKIVNFTPTTWLALWIYTIFISAILCICNGLYGIVAAIWVILCYIQVSLMFALLSRNRYIFENLINPEHLRLHRHNVTVFQDKKEHEYGEISLQGMTEEAKRGIEALKKGGVEKEIIDEVQQLSEEVGEMVARPTYVEEKDLDTYDDASCARARAAFAAAENSYLHLVPRLKSIDYRKPFYTTREMQQACWFSAYMMGKLPPNRHESLFLFDKMGPAMNIYFLRLHLLLQSIYFAVVTCFFCPIFFKEYGVAFGIVFVVLALAPIPFQYLVLYPQLIFYMPQVAATGLLKEKEIEAEVSRTQKLRKIIGLMKMLAKIDAAKKLNEGPGPDTSDPAIAGKVNQAQDVYRSYDKDGKGVFTPTQFVSMGKACGIDIDEDDVQEVYDMVIMDGVISMERFIRWVIASGEDKGEVAVAIFKSLDNDGSGELLLDEFRQGLMKFNDPPYNAGLTDEEVLAIVRDFDEDGSGSISLEEFKAVVESAEK